MAQILCVDDEPAIGAVVGHMLQRMGHQCRAVASVEEALHAVTDSPFDLILSDYQMPGQTGLDLIRLLAAEGRRIPVILMTGFSGAEHAVTFIKSGAIDYLTKPVSHEALEIAVIQALDLIWLRRENESLRREVSTLRLSRTLIGESEPWRRLMETVNAAAPTRATVVIEGEPGTGKQLIARALHDRSPWAECPFVSVSCAALPDDLVESALFGGEMGEGTADAVRTAGAFERARGGTLLLDEISEMRLDLQAKFLRVIEEQEFERVGGEHMVKRDVRLLATTRRDLEAEVEAGRFRGDLYDRLNVVCIRTPPLRQRADDIPRLAQYFLQRTAEQLGLEPPRLPLETIELLQEYHWPGNVRELANAVERALILSRGGPLLPSAFRGHLGDASPRDRAASEAAVPERRADGPFDLATLERQAIDRALSATGGNRVRAAKLLGINERTLRNKLKAQQPPKAS